MTWLDAIMTSVKTKLVADGVFDVNYLYLTLLDDQGLPPGTDQYGTILAGPQRPDQGAIRGGGNTTPIIDGEIAVIVWNRLYVDQDNRDDAFLTDATLGALQKMRKVMKSLQLFDPVNGSADFLLTEPMRLANPGWLVRPRRIQPGWGSIATTWMFQYLADLVS